MHTQQNYGEFFDLGPEGLAGGPVELNVDGMASLNLSSNIWNYKVIDEIKAQTYCILKLQNYVDLIDCV